MVRGTFWSNLGVSISSAGPDHELLLSLPVLDQLEEEEEDPNIGMWIDGILQESTQTVQSQLDQAQLTRPSYSILIKMTQVRK